MKITLTAEEKHLLLTKISLQEHLKSIILSAPVNSEIEITDDDAADLREHVTDTLDLIGFDPNDDPTPDGLILESLVDKFFVP